MEPQAQAAPRAQENPPSAPPPQKPADPTPKVTLLPQQPTRVGGVYVPPHKVRRMQEEEMKKAAKFGEAHQRFLWEMLRKSINGIVNKVNVSNIQNIILELLNENLLRGKGLFVKAIMRSQMASPNFTHVYAALIAAINTKLPEHGKLLVHRYIQQFQNSFKRNNKIVCIAATKMLAHLVNQQVIHELLGLEILALLLENPTEDSVEIAADFMTECGQVLSEVSPPGTNAIFERFKGILHEGEIDKRVQYIIENLFAVRKNNFANHPGIIPELDLVEDDDRIIHQITLEEKPDTQDHLNLFKFDINYEKTESEWQAIKVEILGEEEARLNRKQAKAAASGEAAEGAVPAEEENMNDPNMIMDFSEKDLQNLRRTIYLTIVSCVDFEECAHKLLKLTIRPGQEVELVTMILECSMQERTYGRFYGLLSQRFCALSELYKQRFEEAFTRQYATIHRLDTNKLRNVAKLFAHLLYTDAIEWKVFDCIKVTETDTTASSRIFIKILFQTLCEQMGVEKLHKRLLEETLIPHFTGLFPKDNLTNTRFSINFFTSIGLGALTEEMRDFLDKAPKMILQQQYEALKKELEEAQKQKEKEKDSESDSKSSYSSVSSESKKSSSRSASRGKGAKREDIVEGKKKESEKKKEKSKRKSRSRSRAQSRSGIHSRSRSKSNRRHRSKSRSRSGSQEKRRRRHDSRSGSKK